jgi:hypothetical protein
MRGWARVGIIGVILVGCGTAPPPEPSISVGTDVASDQEDVAVGESDLADATDDATDLDTIDDAKVFDAGGDVEDVDNDAGLDGEASVDVEPGTDQAGGDADEGSDSIQDTADTPDVLDPGDLGIVVKGSLLRLGAPFSQPIACVGAVCVQGGLQ